MNIFYVSPLNTGCSKWRAEIPAKYLRRRGHTVNFFGQSGLSECPDAIVFGRTYKNTADMTRLFNWAKSRKVRVIYDTDDALDLVDPWNPAFSDSRKQEETALTMVTRADVVTTTTPELAQHLKKWNPNVVVVPNSVDPEEWAPRPRSANQPIRVGWLGGNSHFLDIAIALDAIADLKKRSNFTFVIYGLTTYGSVREMYEKHSSVEGETFRSSPLGRAVKVFLKKTEGLAYEFFPFVPASQYAQTLCDLRLDIGLAPLSATSFNRHKSCVKYYEYAMSGAATLASDVLPYSDEVPRRADNARKSWTSGLTELLQLNLGQTAQQEREWVLANRNIEHSVALWENVFMAGKSSQVPGTEELVTA